MGSGYTGVASGMLSVLRNHESGCEQGTCDSRNPRGVGVLSGTGVSVPPVTGTAVLRPSLPLTVFSLHALLRAGLFCIPRKDWPNAPVLKSLAHPLGRVVSGSRLAWPPGHPRWDRSTAEGPLSAGVFNSLTDLR